jgi:chemotaxis protein methyltransferase CheR
MTRIFNLELNDSDFSALRKLIAEEAGIQLSEFKKVFLMSRLSPRIKNLGLSNVRSYLKLLDNPESQKEEIGHLINQITTNETRFFRENHHFTFLTEDYLPALIGEDTSPRKLSFWCAGCATGEEAYSLAMVLSEFRKRHPWVQPSILATDIDSIALDKARAGLFPERATRDIPAVFLKKYFLKGVRERSGWIKTRSRLKELITFEYFNLHKPKIFSWGPFDGIFCRNVLIYFLPQAQEKVQEVFYQNLLPTGLLFLGHSEVIFEKDHIFKSLGKTIYQKKE